MLLWLVQMGGYRRRCAKLSGRWGCECKWWVDWAKWSETQKLSGCLPQFFSPKADIKTKRMLLWLVQMGGYCLRCVLLSGRCRCECERWVNAAKWSLIQKLSSCLPWFFLKADVKTKRMLLWLVQMGGYCQRCALLIERCGCEYERRVDTAQWAVNPKLLGCLQWFFPPESQHKTKRMLLWLV